MSFESCITKPHGIKYIALREDYLAFCKGKICPALIISYFEYWHNHKVMEMHKNRTAHNEGYGSYQFNPSDYYQRHSLNDIEQGIFSQYKKECISAGIDFLIDCGVLEIVHTANYRRNLARVYLFHPEVINEFIHKTYTPNNTLTPAIPRNFVVEKSTAQTYKEDSLGKDSKESCANAPSGKFVRRKKQPSLFPSKDVEECFMFWNTLGYPLAKHKTDITSKIFTESLQNIQKALKKHTVADITQAMANYHKLITATNTTINLAIPGHKVSLPEFFKFSKHTEERMIKQTQMLEIDSWFDECLKGWEHLESTFGRYIKDHHPKITEELKKQYQSKINNRNFSVSEINCFIKAAKFIVEYHNKQLKKINWNSCPQE